MLYKNYLNTYIDNKSILSYLKTSNKLNTNYHHMWRSLPEFYKTSRAALPAKYLFWAPMLFNLADINILKYTTTKFIFYDLINLNRVWRLVRGYPSKGQRTRSNANQSKKLKLINTFRLDQFFLFFGVRKRNIFPSLILGEYTNRLFFYNWLVEWREAQVFALRLMTPKKFKIPFNPVSLSKNFTNGYTRVGAASKIGKAKKVANFATIGLPLFFSRWLFLDQPPKSFPFKIWISDTDRKKMGKKKKKKKK